jgi:hypothetical protein
LRLEEIGIELGIQGERLVYRAPRGVLSNDLIEEMRVNKDGLIERVRATQSLPPLDSSNTVGPIRGVLCPFCKRARFIQEPSGWRCIYCKQLAWGWIGSSFVRADCIALPL